MFEYSLGENITDAELSDPRKWNPEELTKAFHEDGLNDGKAQVFFLYRKPYTQSVTEIREEIKLCEGDKYQCVGVFLDYVEKINTIDKSLFRDNEYARLGVVTSELAAFGKETNRFIVTSAQLNRASIAKLEEFASKGKTDIGRDLMSSEASDSKKLLDNCDVVIIQNLEKIVNEVQKKLYNFLSLKRVKVRGKDTLLNPYGVIKFVDSNGIALEEDLFDKNPDFRHSIEEFFPPGTLYRPQSTEVTEADVRDSSENKLERRKNQAALSNSVKLIKRKRTRSQEDEYDGVDNIIESSEEFSPDGDVF